MKTLLKKLLPRSGKRLKVKRLPDAQYEALPALKCGVWYNEYGGYCLPEASLHRSAARRVLRGQVHEPDTIAFMREHCAAGDIVHAGTYFGDFLPGLASACADGAKVWAFEPNPENFRCASITAMINGLSNVQLHNGGLGEEAATLRMRTRGEDGRALGGMSHIIAAEDFDSARDERVDIVTIDSSVPADRVVTIIQLDVEDHEKAALTGAMQTIRRCSPILIVEVRRESDLLDSPWFAETILALGYRQTNTLHSNVVFELK